MMACCNNNIKQVLKTRKYYLNIYKYRQYLLILRTTLYNCWSKKLYCVHTGKLVRVAETAFASVANAFEII